ncbi:MAG: ketopantoate reductase family protein, partial [Candidatus Methanospirareceae archaeon]
MRGKERIMVMGAGAIGSLFGGLIASAGYDVVLVGREEHVREIKRKGLHISGLTERRIKIDAETSPRGIEADFVLFTVKSYDTEEAARQIEVKEETAVVSLQNGLGNEEKIAHIIGIEHVVGGVTSYGAIFKEPAHIIHTGVGYTVIGELDGRITDRVRRICEIFNDAGIKTEISTDIRKNKWEKLVINAAI